MVNADDTNNGLSLALFNRGKNRNGIALGAFLSNFSDTANGLIIGGFQSGARVLNGLGLGLLSTEAIIFNGIGIAGMGVGSERFNGVGIGGTVVGAKKFNGVGIAVMGGILGDTLNGFFTGLNISMYPFKERIHQLNGLGIAYLITVVNVTKGVVLSPINLSKEQNGVSVGVFNRTEKLKGFQFGLINYAGNNHRLLRWLPIINMHFGK